MASASVRATCPGCQHQLRIPRELLGQPVKCKKCGTIIRSKAKGDSPTPPGALPGAYPQDLIASTPSQASGIHFAYGQQQGVSHTSTGITGSAYPVASPYAPPAGYGIPVGASVVNNVEELEPTLSRTTRSYRSGRRYQRGDSSTALYITIAFGLFLIVGLTAAAVFLPGYVKRNRSIEVVSNNITSSNVVSPNSQVGTQSVTPTPSFGPMPRRMLFVQINNYLYLNPLTSAAPAGRSYGPDRTRAVARRLAYDWRVNTEKENNQVYVLSDMGPAAEVRAPFKSVLNETFQKFFDTSRAQDRILVYFGGHAVEIDGKAYIVPIEGDTEEPESLIPVRDLYARLATCRATQKVLIWDVCRYNPQRGNTRKGSEPMSETLEKALTSDIPPGVEVVLTCSKDQYALEFFSYQVPGETSDHSITGSNFLQASIYVANKTRNKPKAVSPNDPYPVAEWVEALGKRVNEVAQSMPKEEGKTLNQTPKVYGSLGSSLVAYNPNEPPPARFELPQPPRSASPDLVAAIRSETSLPPLLKSGDEEDGLASFPFLAEKLEPYKNGPTIAQIEASKDMYPFEATVLESFRKIRDVWEGKAAGTTTNSEIRRVFEGETTDAAKKTIKEDQIYPALAILELEEIIMALKKLEPEREKASKRWQANYDYCVAQAKARLAFMNEYNLLLGQIFTPEVLPPLDREKAGHTGWALASREKMKSKRDIQALRDEARELYAQMIEHYKGTPWEILAKREKGIALGLEWQPYSPGGRTMD